MQHFLIYGMSQWYNFDFDTDFRRLQIQIYIRYGYYKPATEVVQPQNYNCNFF